MIKVYQVSRRYIMLFMHNNKYLPLTGLFILFRELYIIQHKQQHKQQKNVR